MNDKNSKIQVYAQKLADELQLAISLPAASEANHPVRIAVIGPPRTCSACWANSSTGSSP